ncbi:hypothetical protein SAMN04488032_105216 [Pacificibacter marinus]|uniref:TfoX N-terminal domain-containing protein n=2 Tax=Pacificibacter marinus TaxID=658057 RepID=A0A1Y5SMJ9_9RHOB|nr:hypothetical protein SAMN04488032_105216 [Pacificibacter marinus]SLN44022.1 hypothetical protein PAM7971_02110 [Pacificibacter marinus]
MKASDKIFTALAMSHKGVDVTQKGKSSVFDHAGNAFAKLGDNRSGFLKLGVSQHAAFVELCAAGAVVAEQQDGWTYLQLNSIDVALLADYIGAAYRSVAPKTRLSF